MENPPILKVFLPNRNHDADADENMMGIRKNPWGTQSTSYDFDNPPARVQRPVTFASVRCSQQPGRRTIYQTSVSAAINQTTPQTPPRIISSPSCLNSSLYRRPVALMRQQSAPISRVDRVHGLATAESNHCQPPMSAFRATHRVTQCYDLPGARTINDIPSNYNKRHHCHRDNNQKQLRLMNSSPYETGDEPDILDFKRKDEIVYRPQRCNQINLLPSLPTSMRQEDSAYSRSSCGSAKLRDSPPLVPVTRFNERNTVNYQQHQPSLSIPTNLSWLSCPEPQHSGSSSGIRSNASSYIHGDSYTGDPSINSDDQDSAKNLAPLRSDMNNPNDENQSTSLSSVADEESPDSQDPADATITNAMDNDDDDDDRRMPSATAAASHSHVHDGVRANSEIDKSHAQELLASKNMLARLIVLSYARVLASMEEEFKITQVPAADYEATKAAYQKALDEFELTRIVTTHAESKWRAAEEDAKKEHERKATLNQSTYRLSANVLRKISFGSLQNVLQAQEEERKRSTQNPDSLVRQRRRSRETRACSAPRDNQITPTATPSSSLPPTAPASLAPQKLPTETATPIQLSNLRRWFSSKALSGSLPSLNPPSSSSFSTVATHTRVGRNRAASTATSSPLQSSTHLQQIYVPEDPESLDQLIAFKRLEVATLMNIQRANSTIAAKSRRSRKAYKLSYEENEQKIECMLQEIQYLKQVRRQYRLSGRSLSVSRISGMGSRTLPRHEVREMTDLSKDTSATLETHPSGVRQNRSYVDAISLSTTNSDSANLPPAPNAAASSSPSVSCSKQLPTAPLAVICPPAASTRNDDGYIAHQVNPQQFLSSPSLLSASTISMTTPAFHETPRVAKQVTEEDVFIKPSVNTVQCHYLEEPQNQLPMRSYGRPNYSRGSSLPRLNDEVECSPNQHFFPSHYNGLQQPLHTASFTQPPAMNPLGCGNNNARPCVSFISPTTTTTPLASHGMSSPHHLPDSINGIKPISELERLTNRVGFEVGSSELPTRLRYTLADKLNMSTSAFH